MIIGIGNDVVFYPRMVRVYARFADRFARRVLTQEESGSAVAMPMLIARCWAAKEALAKAVGCGIRPPVVWRNITVKKDEHGAPFFVFAAPLQAYLHERQIGQCHLSISHDGDYIFASVIATRA